MSFTLYEEKNTNKKIKNSLVVVYWRQIKQINSKEKSYTTRHN